MSHIKLRFTDEEIEKVNNIDLMDYAINQCLELKRVGMDSYHVEGYGGLYINPRLNKWNCFSRDKGGGPIQFVMFMENKTWIESVKTLLGHTSNNNSVNQYIEPKEIIEEKAEFILPKKNNTYKHVIVYLIKTRKIDKDIVYRLIKEGKLYEDKYSNCVFIGYDKTNNPRYASLRGTNTNIVFKGDVKGSDKSYPFCIKGKSSKLYVCEAPIEVISYITLLKASTVNSFDHHIISLGGIGDIALDGYLINNPNIKEIILCLNNDKAGIKATNQIKEKYIEKYNIKIHYPIKKDFNDDLQDLADIKRVNKREWLLERNEEEEMSPEL